MGTRLGRYDVIRTLAKGSLTDLLLGCASGEAGFQRHVAIKQLREEHAQDPACLEMFVNEARLAAALHHHNIVQVTDIGDDAGRPFFAMEYVHGVDLRTLLGHLARKGEQLPLQHVVSIIASAAAALHHAHEQRGPDGSPLGIVHRQVTPANILVGYDGNVKIVDFGIAKAAIKRIQTGVGVLKGSAPYMAPEQCAGRTVDRRSDVFALGIVLYELATVRRLFKGANEFLTMSAVVNAEVPRPSQYRRDVPPELEVVMLKALARDPLARYQTASDMANALDNVARAVGVGASTTALANYLKLQFGEVKEPWLDASVEADPETTAVDFDGGASGLAPPPSEAVKSNAIPKAVSATKSSPIAQARASSVTPSRPKRASVVPMDKSFSVATAVDDPEPASSRASTDIEDEPDAASTINMSATSRKRSPTKQTVPPPMRGTAPPAAPPPSPPPPSPPPVAVVAAAPPKDVAPQDETAIVEPLAVVVARAQTVKGGGSNKLMYIAGGVAVLAAIVLAIVLWPSPELQANSAGPVADTEASEPEPAPPPPPAAEEPPQKSAMEMTARDYEESRNATDAGVAEVVPTDAAIVTEVVADAAIVTEVVADAAVVEPPDAAVVADKSEESKAAKPAPKTAKRTTKTATKTATKRTTTPKKKTAKKTTTKKTAKPKWDPDDLFLGE